jgi:hypothetical protein
MLVYVSEKGWNPTLCGGVAVLLDLEKEGVYARTIVVSEVL